MALTLLESTKLNPGAVIRNSIIEEFARSSDVLRVLPFQTIPGNSLSYSRESVLPSVGARGVNEGYTESTGVKSPQSEALKIYGGDLDVDSFILSTSGIGQRVVEETMKIKALAHYWTKSFIKGDSSSNPRNFDGLQIRLDGSQLFDAGSTSGGDPLSLAALDELIDSVDMPSHLIMNRTMRRRLAAASRDVSVGGQINYSVDEFGAKITSYAGLPILIADYDETGTQIMPFTEENPGGGTPASTSIYCVSIGDGRLQGIQGYNYDGSEGMTVRDLGELNEKPVWRTRIDWFTAFVIYQSRAAARLRGITNAAIIA